MAVLRFLMQQSLLHVPAVAARHRVAADRLARGDFGSRKQKNPSRSIVVYYQHLVGNEHKGTGYDDVT